RQHRQRPLARVIGDAAGAAHDDRIGRTERRHERRECLEISGAASESHSNEPLENGLAVPPHRAFHSGFAKQRCALQHSIRAAEQHPAPEPELPPRVRNGPCAGAVTCECSGIFGDHIDRRGRKVLAQPLHRHLQHCHVAQVAELVVAAVDENASRFREAMHGHNSTGSSRSMVAPPIWYVHKRRYTSQLRINSSWVSKPTRRPCSITMMRSAWRSVDRRWAMMNVVRPCMRRSSALWKRRSLTASRLLVASSRNNKGAFLSSAAAMQMRCFCPVETPRASRARPSMVSYPRSMRSISSCTLAAFAASITSAIDASGREMRMLFAIVSRKRNGSWSTIALWSIKSACLMLRRSTPSNVIRPLFGSYRRSMSAMSVVLPAPDGPTMPIVSPRWIVALIESSTNCPS